MKMFIFLVEKIDEKNFFFHIQMQTTFSFDHVNRHTNSAYEKKFYDFADDAYINHGQMNKSTLKQTKLYGNVVRQKKVHSTERDSHTEEERNFVSLPL